MKGKVLLPLLPLILVALLISYYLDTYTHRTINVAEVSSISVDSKKYTPDKDIDEITKIISMFNEASVYRKDGDTTPSHTILIELFSGEKIEVSGTTQGFQYVHEESRDYKISGKGFNEYIKGLETVNKP